MITFEDLLQLKENVFQYTTPEALFGTLTSPDKKKQLKGQYARLIKGCHPDRCQHLDQQGQDLAAEIFRYIDAMYKKGKDKLDAGRYGQEDPDPTVPHAVITTRKRSYKILKHLAEGDYTSAYLGVYQTERNNTVKVCVKIVRDSDDNDLMAREQKVLQLVRHTHIPQLIDTFRTTDDQSGTIMEYIEGYDFLSIREKYPNGVPQEHFFWMFERLLSGLGYLHSKKVSHGNLTPEHILIRPRDHNAIMIDFLCSVIDPKPTDTFVAVTPLYTPPEAYQKMPPVEASDIYSLGKCCIYVLGGEPEKNTLPTHVDRRLSHLLLEMVKKNPMHRPSHAYDVWRTVMELRKQIYGTWRFVEFPM